jgi:hypothetical protein
VLIHRLKDILTKVVKIGPIGDRGIDEITNSNVSKQLHMQNSSLFNVSNVLPRHLGFSTV